MLVAVDLDGTVWDHKDISSLYPPFRRISTHVIVDKNGEAVNLRPRVEDFLKWARQEGFILSTLSWNDYDVAYQALRAFELDRYFHYIVVEPHPRKDKMLYRLLQQIKRERGVEIRPQDVVYIDDRDIHLREILENVGPVKFIHFGKDVKCFSEIPPLLSNYGGSNSRHGV